MIRELTHERKEYWIKQGKRFGYPECCIEAFLTEPLPRRQTVFTGSGLILCKCCETKTIDEILDIIEANRTEVLPFPFDGCVDSDFLDRLSSELQTVLKKRRINR